MGFATAVFAIATATGLGFLARPTVKELFKPKPTAQLPVPFPNNDAADEEKKKLAKRPALRSTIFTSSQGVLSPAKTGKRKLLGN